MKTIRSKTTALFLSLFALAAIAGTPGCIGTTDSEGGDDFIDQAATPHGDEDVGESQDAIKGKIFQGCPYGTWECGGYCTSTDYTCG